MLYTQRIGTTAVGTIVVEAGTVTRDFPLASGIVKALRGVSMHVAQGEVVALRGRSGAGKTTLLNILLGLDDPTTGSISLLGQDLARLSEERRARLRREQVGILFQNAHLFPSLTAQENVEIALRLLELPAMERRERAREAIARVGLSERAHHRGLELSGGEQQRIALARALAHHPRLLVADEPTGNLDTRTGREIASLLLAVAHEEGIGVLVATHDQAVVAVADRVVMLEDGLVRQE